MLRRFATAWLGEKEGTTAIEFALMIVPYLMLTLSIIELSMMYAAGSLLEGATGSAARMIRTGQLQQTEGEDPEAMFRQAICNYATVLVNCDDIVIEARPMTSFNDYEEMEPVYDEDGNLVPSGFDAGGSSQRILVRASYRYHMMTPFIGMLLTGPTSSRLFVSTIVLQVEPYDFEDEGA